MQITNKQQTEVSQNADRGFAIAAILAAIPNILWVGLLGIVGGFLILALWYNHNNLESFTNSVILWIGRIVIAGGCVIVIFAIYKGYQMYHVLRLQTAERRTAFAIAEKSELSVEKARLQNRQLEVKIELEQQLPLMMKYAMDNGLNFEYDGKGLRVADFRSNVHTLQSLDNQTPQLGSGEKPVMTFRELFVAGIIQQAIARGEMILGYVDGELFYGTWKKVGSCAIGGVSGSGKTTTVRFLLFQAMMLDNAKFIMIDPAINDPEESLAAQFIRFKHIHLMPPCGLDEEAIMQRLMWLINEFTHRQQLGIKGPPIFLIIDEFNQLMRHLKNVRDDLVALLLDIAQSGRKFGIFVILIGQRWSDRDLGGSGIGAQIRDSLAAFMAHRFASEDQADRLVGSRWGSECLELAQGHHVFRDTETGKTMIKITPNTVMEDGELVMRSIGNKIVESVPETPAIRPVYAHREQIAQHTTQPLYKAPELSIVPKQQPRLATLSDAIEVFNKHNGAIGRPKLREELRALGLECSDDRAKQLMKSIKERQEEAGGAGGVA